MQRAQWLSRAIESADRAIIAQSPDGTIQLWNKAAERLFGHTEQEAIGHNISLVLGHEAMTEFLSNDTDGRPRAMRGLSRDGGVIEGSLTSVPLCSREDPGVTLMFIEQGAAAADHAHAANDEQPETGVFAQAIVDAMREPLVVLDENQRLVSANRSFYQTFDLRPEATLGQPIYRIGDRQWDIPELRALLDDVLPRHQAFDDFEVEGDFAGLGRRKMVLNARRIPGTQGGPDLILLVIDDITDRRMTAAVRRANEALRQRNEEMEQFIYTVSHDLKSPLVTTMGFLGMLREELAEGNTDEVLDAVSRIERAAARMSQLIDDLLELSRIGRVRSTPTDIDLVVLAREVADQFQDQLERAGATLTIADDLPAIQADRRRIIGVFENLLSNAIKYGCVEPGGRIEIDAAEDVDGVRVCVRDHGPGIEQRYHDKIFGLFQRLDASREGTGVGLALVAKVLQAHGGRVWVESAPGEGAAFWLFFPRRRDGREQGS